MAKIKVDRTRQWSYFFVPISLHLDGKLLGRVRSGTTAEFEVEDGNHVLQASFLSTYSNILQFESSHGRFFHFQLGSDVNMSKNLWLIVKHPLVLVALYFLDKLINWDYFLLVALLAYIAYEIVDNKRKKREQKNKPEPDKYYIYLREII